MAQDYPVLFRSLYVRAMNWVDYTIELLSRFGADWERIRTGLFPESDPGRLTAIAAGAGDTHRQGRTVAILQFSSGLKLVYKPRSMSLDVHFAEFLEWVNQSGFEPRFIELAHQVNTSMPHVVLSIVVDVLNDRGRSLKGATVLVLGASYKRDVNDARESPAIEIMVELTKRGTNVCYHDPYVPGLEIAGRSFESLPLDDALLARADCVLITTDHTSVDYDRVVALSKVVVDTRNATRDVVRHREKIVRL
jgi:hypothetical protein